jgi:tetraacyldisaccharide 4'-kinase
MKFMAPKFWYKSNLLGYILYPLSLLYLLFRYLHILISKQKRFSKKLVTIGNVTVGGAGKTPVAIAISDILSAKEIKFCFLAKGYGAKEKGPLLVDKRYHDAFLVGDEPMLLNQNGDCYVSYNRLQADSLISESDADVIIMDDGYQNPNIKHDVKILVIDGDMRFGNGMLLPAGPLRDFPAKTVRNADMVIIIGEVNPGFEVYLRNLNQKLFLAKREISRPKKGKKYFAFSGLANNEKFFSSIEQVGYKIERRKEFPDHYRYKDKDIEEMINIATSQQLQLVTTAKDLVKIPINFRYKMEVVQLEILFDDEKGVSDELLVSLLSS